MQLISIAKTLHINTLLKVNEEIIELENYFSCMKHGFFENQVLINL